MPWALNPHRKAAQGRAGQARAGQGGRQGRAGRAQGTGHRAGAGFKQLTYLNNRIQMNSII